MKKITLLLVMLLVFSTLLYAIDVPVALPETRATNARVMAMGEAFTAVADDADALYYNPAGLAFLPNGDLNIGGSFLIDTNANMVNVDEWIYKYPDAPANFDVWDLQYDYQLQGPTWPGSNTVYDISGLGFENTPEGVDDFINWYESTIPPLSVLSNGIDQLRMLPNVSFASRNFGIGLLGDVSINPVELDIVRGIAIPGALEYGFEITKRSGLIAGMGFGFGPLSIGANVKYYKQVTTIFGLPSDSYTDFENYLNVLLPGVSMQDALIDILIDDALAVGGSLENRLEMGFGAMYTLGSLTFGGYVDSILGIILDENNELTSDFESMLFEAAKTANVGIAFDPSMRKLTRREPFMNILLSADLKNIGDDDRRFFNIGTEVGIHIGELAQIDVRGGYKQYLTGSLDSLLDGDIIAVEKGELSIGAGFKALFVQVDIAAALPADLVKNVITTAIAGGDPGQLDYLSYGPNFPRVMFSMGLNL